MSAPATVPHPPRPSLGELAARAGGVLLLLSSIVANFAVAWAAFAK